MPRKPDLPCAGCGKLIWRGSTSRPPGEARCRDCLRHQCGTVAQYKKRGCRCRQCRAANAADMAEYVAKRKAEGNPLKRPNRRNKGERYHLRKGQRRRVYERDGWVCQICLAPVDSSLDPNDRWAATLDHIEPQSTALLADHSIENLRLAHRACNSRRGAGRDDLVAI